MRKRFIALLGVTMGVLAGAAHAEREALSGAVLRDLIAGKTVRMTMYLGSLPITYFADGTMTAESTAVGLATGYSKDKGRWWVKGSNLCQRWENWFARQQYCHAMSREGETLFWVRNDGLTGTAKVLR